MHARTRRSETGRRRSECHRDRLHAAAHEHSHLLLLCAPSASPRTCRTSPTGSRRYSACTPCTAAPGSGTVSPRLPDCLSCLRGLLPWLVSRLVVAAADARRLLRFRLADAFGARRRRATHSTLVLAGQPIGPHGPCTRCVKELLRCCLRRCRVQAGYHTRHVPVVAYHDSVPLSSHRNG